MSVVLPPLDPRITWSIQVLDATAEPGPAAPVLAEHTPTQVCRTASVGKLFLLVEVANRLQDGRLASDQRIEIPDELRVEDSGLLYRMSDQRLTVVDAALLVGAVSDNLATNALAHLVGMDAVHAVARELGYQHTQMLDYIRNERTPEVPWTTSFGCAAELADLIRRLGEGSAPEHPGAELLSDPVRSRVLTWLAADTDTSMLADSFLLDPLAHVGPEYQQMVLHHKTGSIDTARIEVGHLAGPAGRVAYAVAANWADGTDLRAAAVDTMRAIGEQIRHHVTGLAREDAGLS
ncbi:serine hydrolase [Acidipropionibacterium jensenii]|uniref:serine hydrolase n=1 Tax=Acidipropionibacterium jensenii TaxID=1749 RepID=UPI002646FC66|nr:serine hydrolase [Acidipropionibacterium jensenii]MDN5977201.1 class A beta-lactamase-related serine hydrolase [Acidipropionibacterium jensenii]MDN5995883.1 class A beta-lactamase-related serine hydrolase [Acidipropionibacterium jensenii]MDN6427504.1 class A beta-lactamase-related serine hydrolase [Acidipropionibacterium jensenii]MDN6442173.1 class A beta-lactamase-related serine hydrolase [Acidipropionibacterium jensenii]MDN6481031.1 class A beta-lactamase-related serine hydrolase [Acidipr